ncbi:serine--tRNA ligase [Iamia sp.]|uniref:serine--tRNA ligase n=1 Tax=Iamia sp. TaxID=2722710 RepID=UPI002C23A967|nr:serine--tRNA ligase [Iamia sp.]HXH56653.1 serine--tRNA ligase [Iamia sp.]
MLDIRRIRTDLDGVVADLARKGVPPAEVSAVHELDVRQREVAARRDEVRRRVKGLSAEVARLHRDGQPDATDALRAESRNLGDEEARLAGETDALAAEIRELLLGIPNTPHPDAPSGADERDNPVLRVSGYDPDGYGEHQRVPHWTTGEALGILDLERAVKISGSMFTMLRGAGATLSRALCQLALDRNADVHEEIRPPSLVTTATLTAAGQLPKFADDAYAIGRDDLWCIPTSEVPLTSLAAGEVLPAAELPMRFMAYSPCYRREAGSAGRDTRGLLRTHEFDKVEILAYATPEQAPPLLNDMVDRVETLVAALGLAYRVIEICTGDQGQGHHRSFDVEVYAPGCDQWLEVSSVSWFSDYQARRAAIRYRPDGAKGNELVHTLNGSALAVPRVWAAIVETHRRPDGTVAVPEPLWPYMRGIEVIGGA